MITLTINPDKSWTLTFDAKVQAAIDDISAVRGLNFWQDWLNAKFSEMTRRVRHIKDEELHRQLTNAPNDKKSQILNILKGGAP